MRRSPRSSWRGPPRCWLPSSPSSSSSAISQRCTAVRAISVRRVRCSSRRTTSRSAPRSARATCARSRATRPRPPRTPWSTSTTPSVASSRSRCSRAVVLLEPHLTARDRDGLSGLVPVGYRAVRIRPDDGFRPPVGAVVDVLAALDPTLSERREGRDRGACGPRARGRRRRRCARRRSGRYPPRHRGRGARACVRSGERRLDAGARATGGRVLSIVRLIAVLATATSDAASHELTAAKALILGIVEGITEYLPISLDRAPDRDAEAARRRRHGRDQGRGRHVHDHDPGRRDPRGRRALFRRA